MMPIMSYCIQEKIKVSIADFWAVGNIHAQFSARKIDLK
jgi:hypothetical protein